MTRIGTPTSLADQFEALSKAAQAFLECAPGSSSDALDAFESFCFNNRAAISSALTATPPVQERWRKPDAVLELQEVVRALSKPLANMRGGCFKPDHKSDRADCADGDCYCARVARHCAAAAIATIDRLRHPLPAAPEPTAVTPEGEMG